MLGIIALSALPIRAEDRTVALPARESYRKPFDSYNFEAGENDEFQRLIKITVSPAKFPYPLLKYRFNSVSSELESGNAAPLYSQAWAEFGKIYAELEKNWYASNEYFELKKSGASEDQIFNELFRAVPLEPAWPHNSFPKSITPEEEAKFYQSMERVYLLLEKASRMRTADWSYCMEYKGISTNLEHLQNMRGLARYLSGKADWEIRNGRYEDAVKTLRIGIALGNHVAKANFPTLIGMLVGIAIQGIMEQHIMVMESQPDSPNFYPALTQIIFPGDSFQYALQGERFFPFATSNAMPIFENIEKASAEECRGRLENVVATFFQIKTGRWLEPPEKTQVAAAMAMVCTVCYPSGRDRLLAEGMKPEEVEKMTVYQVVAPFVLQKISEAYDRIQVTASFPPGSSHTAIDFEVHDYLKGQTPVDVYLSLMMPAVDSAQRASLRMQQMYELHKIIEAIRYYAAVHDGRLPDSLGAIKEVPVATIDPMSGKPFGYRVEGRTVKIDFSHTGKCRLNITVQENAESKAEK
jgi:hypothetical protein